MTGGLGFSRFGRDAFKENKKLGKIRPRLSENPYSHAKGKRKAGGKLEEFATWQALQDARQQKQALILRALLFTSIFIGLMVYYLL